MIYTTLCVMFLMQADTLRGQVGGGWASDHVHMIRGPEQAVHVHGTFKNYTTSQTHKKVPADLTQKDKT
jgi:hypothetical protein